MKTCGRLLLCAAFVASVSGSSLASAQTVDEIVEKALTALGGREALGKITSRAAAGKITVATPGGDIPGTIEVWNQSPNKSRTLLTLDASALGAGTITVDQRFDGSDGVAIDSMRGTNAISGGQLENMRNAAFPSPLLTYKERGTKIELTGKQKVGDRDAYLLVLTPKTGPAARQFIDAETYLPLRAIVTIDTPETGAIEQTTDFSDFRVVDGVQVPFAVKGTSAVQNISVALTKVEHNVKIDPALFGKPDKGGQ
jgi:outer membrane lipoprotein-sorting protein